MKLVLRDANHEYWAGVEASPVEIEGITLYLHKTDPGSVMGDDDVWRATEPRTGFFIAHGSTMGQALAKAEAKIHAEAAKLNVSPKVAIKRAIDAQTKGAKTYVAARRKHSRGKTTSA